MNVIDLNLKLILTRWTVIFNVFLPTPLAEKMKIICLMLLV